MKSKKLFLIYVVIGLFSCLQINAQNATVRELLENNKSKNDTTIIRVSAESYYLVQNVFFYNVKNKLDVGSDGSDSLYVDEKGKDDWFAAIRKVFSQSRINELANSNAIFGVTAICDSVGYVKECVFFLVNPTDVKLEEIELLEKMIKKNIKFDFKCTTPGVKYYSIALSCRFVVLADNIPESEKRANIFRKR